MVALLGTLDCDLVMEASPVDLTSGEPGLSIVRTALSRGISAVLANKGPMVLAFRELEALAAAKGAKLAYSATVCGGLPVVNVGQRDLVAGEITALRGIFNATSNFILEAMARGLSYDEALVETQRAGAAEADPSLDVEGWDTANKLVIIANSFLGRSPTLGDVAVEGITGVTLEDIEREARAGRVIKLIASFDGKFYKVAPATVPRASFLGGCGEWEMAVEIESDIYGLQSMKIHEREPVATAAAMLRDAVNIFS